MSSACSLRAGALRSGGVQGPIKGVAPIKGVGLLHGYIIEMIAVIYAYYTAGRLSMNTDWSGRVTTFIYDGQSRLSRVSFPQRHPPHSGL
jgi:YD repeat-containing protein